jgi:ubiquinone/menaquinone biosynthesis C-methylase UbiE
VLASHPRNRAWEILGGVSREVRSIRRGGAAGEPDRFDAQARGFDTRAGLPVGAARAVGRAVLQVGAVGPDDLLVELGAGTGEIGLHLLESTRYVGIERSRAMLEVFREKLGSVEDPRVRLCRSDADQPWPVDDSSAAVVFASRVAHLLDAKHLLAELQRVCRPEGCFLVGRVVRDPDGVKSRLRRQRRLLLRQQGVAPRDAEEATERAVRELVGCGAVRVEPRAVATWTSSASVGEILDDWRAVGAAGGERLSATARARVLTEMERWAARELGDRDKLAAWDERYVLQGVRMASDRGAASHGR